MTRKTIGLLALVLILMGCTKFGKNIRIHGISLNPNTNEGIANMELTLLKGNGSFWGGYEEVMTLSTDANGEFDIDHLGGTAKYYLRAENKEGYTIGWSENDEYIGLQSIGIQKGKTMWVEFRTVPMGEISLHFENVNCEGPNDQMQFRFRSEFEPEYYSWSTIRKGCYNFSSNGSVSVPSGYRYYETMVTRSGVTTIVRDTVFVPENGEVLVELLY